MKALGLTTQDQRKAALMLLRRAAKVERDIAQAARQLRQLREKADGEILGLIRWPAPRAAGEEPSAGDE